MTDYFRGANASDYFAPAPGWFDEAVLGDPSSQVQLSIESARELREVWRRSCLRRDLTTSAGVKTLSALMTGAMEYDAEARPEVRDLLEQWQVGLERRKRAQERVGYPAGHGGVGSVNNPAEATAIMTAASIFHHADGGWRDTAGGRAGAVSPHGDDGGDNRTRPRNAATGENGGDYRGGDGGGLVAFPKHDD